MAALVTLVHITISFCDSDDIVIGILYDASHLDSWFCISTAIFAGHPRWAMGEADGLSRFKWLEGIHSCRDRISRVFVTFTEVFLQMMYAYTIVYFHFCLFLPALGRFRLVMGRWFQGTPWPSAGMQQKRSRQVPIKKKRRAKELPGAAKKMR